MGWMIGGLSPDRGGNLTLHHHIQTSSEAHPASYPMGTRGSSLGVKQPGCEADDSPPSSVKVKNVWSYTSISPNTPSRHSDQLKHWGNFTFTFKKHVYMT
jgi:hypothetical protein